MITSDQFCAGQTTAPVKRIPTYEDEITNSTEFAQRWGDHSQHNMHLTSNLRNYYTLMLILFCSICFVHNMVMHISTHFFLNSNPRYEPKFSIRQRCPNFSRVVNLLKVNFQTLCTASW